MSGGLTVTSQLKVQDQTPRPVSCQFWGLCTSVLSLLYNLQRHWVNLPAGLSPYRWPSDGVPLAHSVPVPPGALSVGAAVLHFWPGDALPWPERRLLVFSCRLCVYYLGWARGSGFHQLGHLLCFPIQCKRPDRQAALPWKHSYSLERCASFWQTWCRQRTMNATRS